MRIDSLKARPIAVTLSATTCALALGTLTLSACGKNSESDSAGATGFDDAAARSTLFLSAAELDVKNTSVINGSALESEVNGLSDLYAEEPDSEDADDDKAMSACFDKNISFKVQIDGNKLIVVGEAKPFECKTDEEQLIKYSSFRVALHGQCEELTEAAKALNGKSFAETAGVVSACKFGTEARFVSQVKSTFELSVGKEYSVSAKILSSTTSADGGPCVEKDGILDGCMTTEVDDFKATVAGKATTTLKKTVLTHQKTKQSVSATQKFFDGGTMAIVLGDWTGSAKYTAADAAPLWTLTRGSESKNGTFGKKTASEETTSDLNLRAESAGREISRMVRTKLLPRFN